MTPPNFEQIAAEDLPCEVGSLKHLGCCDESGHSMYCPAHHRPAVAAKLREMYEQGRRDADDEAIEGDN